MNEVSKLMKKLFVVDDASTPYGDEVPWHNAYVKDHNNIGNETLIVRVISCNTGLLLLGEDFKDYIYKGKKVYDQLIEALDHFVEFPGDSIPLLMESSRNRNAEIGTIEGYEGDSVWLKDDKGYRFLPNQGITPDTTSSNPFMPPTTTKATKKRSGGTPKT